jgi:putative copper export protein
MPGVALTVAYALHLVATAVWIGGLTFLAFFAPGLLQRLLARERASAFDASVRRFLPLAWLSLAIFVGTGLLQMSANPNYQGLLVVHNTWAAAILAKHLVVAAMVVLMAYQTWVVRARLERLALGLRTDEPGAVERLRRQESRLIRASAVLGFVVLVLTAIARTSG